MDTNNSTASTYLNENRCPLCHKQVAQSEYLKEVLGIDPIVLWLANLVTHYRHNHITSWNKCWERTGESYRKGWFGNYDEEKIKVNERAKRELVRKGYTIMKENGVTSEHFLKLRDTKPETIKVAKKFLN